MNKFTPGPWEAYKAPACWLVGSPGVSVVAEVYSADTGVAKANARRIVQCVNSFDDLLKACQLVTETAGDSGYLDRFLDENIGRLGVYLTPNELRMIQAAIARATYRKRRAATGGSHDT